MSYRLVAHLIDKKQHTSTATLVPRESLIEPSAQAASLIEELRSAMRRHSPQGAKFMQPAGMKAPLQARLVDYRNAPSDDAFLAMSLTSARKLMAEMEDESATVGGYLVFAEFSHSEEDYLIVMLLSTKARARFDLRLELSAVTTLDVDHVRHAARFRYSGVASNEAGTAQFVARSSDGAFFRKFIDCDPISDTTVQANNLRSALAGWCDENKLGEDGREELYKKTYSYWKDCKNNGTNMTLSGIANQLEPNDPDKLLKFLSDEKLNLSGEFPVPTAKAMRQFQRFSFSGKGLKLEFDRRKWGEKIAITNGNITIKKAPPELIEALSNDDQ